ncbi:MAG: hypothetical protein GY835_12300 [bacterium]|nr:hypothetical protein [bacterium]
MRRMLITLLLIAAPVVALAGPSIVGSMNGWDPASVDWELAPLGTAYSITALLDTGAHEYKVTETDSWDGNDFPGFNIGINLEGNEEMTWYVNLGATVGVKEGDEFVAHQNPIIAGNFIEIWGGTNWDPADFTGGMGHIADAIFEKQGILPAGQYECKVTLNGNWDQDTGDNFVFDLDIESIVTFNYDFGTNTLTLDHVVPAAEMTISEVKSLY